MNVTTNVYSEPGLSPDIHLTCVTVSDMAKATLEVAGRLPVRHFDALSQADRALRAVAIRHKNAGALVTRGSCEFSLAGRYGNGRSLYGHPATARDVKSLAERTGNETARVARQTSSMAATVDEASNQ